MPDVYFLLGLGLESHCLSHGDDRWFDFFNTSWCLQDEFGHSRKKNQNKNWGLFTKKEKNEKSLNSFFSYDANIIFPWYFSISRCFQIEARELCLYAICQRVFIKNILNFLNLYNDIVREQITGVRSIHWLIDIHWIIKP